LAKQKRDSKGRFVSEHKKPKEKRKKVTAFIDASGTSDAPPKKDNTTFFVGAVLTDNPKKLSEIAKKERKRLKVKELKYNKHKGSRKDMENATTEAGAEVIGVYVDKKDSPWWWRIKTKRKWQHQAMLAELSKDLVELDVDFDKIVIDDDTSLKHNGKIFTIRDGKRIVKSNIGSERGIKRISQEDSARGRNKDLMQSGDFQIGATRRILENKDPPTPVKFTARNLNNNKKKRNGA